MPGCSLTSSQRLVPSSRAEQPASALRKAAASCAAAAEGLLLLPLSPRLCFLQLRARMQGQGHSGRRGVWKLGSELYHSWAGDRVTPAGAVSEKEQNQSGTSSKPGALATAPPRGPSHY